jgi:hypothetical protein
VLDHRELSGAGDLFENMTNTHRRIPVWEVEKGKVTHKKKKQIRDMII